MPRQVSHNHPSSEPKLLLLNPRQNTCQNKDAQHNRRPQLNVVSRLVESRLCRCAYCCQYQYQHAISSTPMVFVHFLRIIDAAVEGGDEVLCESDKGLEDEEDVRGGTEDGMG